MFHLNCSDKDMGLSNHTELQCDSISGCEKLQPKEPIVPRYQVINGLRICNGFIRKNVLEAMAYKPTKDDIFIATYPKCGTTWTQQIVFLLLNDGRPPADIGEYFSKHPFIDMLGNEGVESMVRPAAIKTHFPFNYVPYSPIAKYICVVRNPKDALVSFFHHTRGIPGYQFANGSFDTYFELFLEGKVDYGDYFDHLISWWDHRYDQNVIFLTFEEMKQDIGTAVHKIASFIDKSIAQKLEKDPIFMQNIVHFSSFDYMKKQDQVVRKPYEMPDQMLSNPTVPRVVKEALLNHISHRQSLDPCDSSTGSQDYAHIRKGIVNDWKNHLTHDQNERLVAKFVQKSSGTGIESLWKTKDWL